MYLYILLIFIIGWIGYLIAKKKYTEKVSKISFLILLYVVCLFAMGFRDSSVGPDTNVYEKIFNKYAHNDWGFIFYEQSSVETFEIGIKLLMKSCSEVISNYYFYQIVFSSIYIGIFFHLIYRYTSNVILATAIFLSGGLYMQTFNVARQMLAVAIISYSMIFLIEKKYLKSFLALGIAYFFHKSCLIASVIYLVYPFRNNKYILALAPMLMLFLLMSIEQFILPFAYNVFGEAYVNYILSEYTRPNKGVILQLMWIFNLIISLISLYYFKRNGSLQFYATLSLLAVGCYWVGLSINYADRMGLYFLPAILLMYDKFGSSIKNKTVKFLYYNGFTIFYILYFYYYTKTIESINYECII